MTHYKVGSDEYLRLCRETVNSKEHKKAIREYLDMDEKSLEALLGALKAISMEEQ